MRRAQLAAAALVVLIVTASGVALASARGNPALSVLAPDNELTPGEDTELEIYLQNAGDVDYASSAAEEARVTTARNVRVALDAEDAPIEIDTGTTPIGNVPEGVTSAIPFEVSVDEDAEAGEYTVTATVSYRYTEQISGVPPVYQERDRSRDLEFTIVIEDDARFSVVEASAEDLYGTSGPITLTLENVGTATARNANVAVESGTSQLTFGTDAAASTFVGNWAPGETRTVTLEGSLAAGANSRSYPISASVDYENTDGESETSETIRTGVTPRVESRFSIQDVQSTLAVGREGRVTGQITNDGLSDARNAVLVLSADNRNLEPTETEYSLGDLGAGESTAFNFDVEVSESAAGGPRQLSFTVRYRDADNAVTESDPIDARVDVGADRATFAVNPVSATLQPGGSGLLELEVTNQGDEPVTAVSAKLFANSPLSTSDDEAFIDRLEPGQTETITFAVSAGGSALAKTYPVSMDFQYDDADGDTLLSDTYQIPVTVEAPAEEGGGLPILPIVVVVVVLAGAGYYLYRRRQSG